MRRWSKRAEAIDKSGVKITYGSFETRGLRYNSMAEHMQKFHFTRSVSGSTRRNCARSILLPF